MYIYSKISDVTESFTVPEFGKIHCTVLKNVTKTYIMLPHPHQNKKNRKYTFLRIVGFYFVYIYLCQKTIVVWQNIFIDIYSFFVLSTKLQRSIAFILLHPLKTEYSIVLNISIRSRLHYKNFIIEKYIQIRIWHLIYFYLFDVRLLCVLWIQLLWPFSLFVCNI